jgi:energy-converting hydrogenase Eha subunit E
MVTVKNTSPYNSSVIMLIGTIRHAKIPSKSPLKVTLLTSVCPHICAFLIFLTNKIDLKIAFLRYLIQMLEEPQL